MGTVLLFSAAKNMRSKVNDSGGICVSKFSRSVVYYPHAGPREVQCHAAAREHACVVDVLIGAGFDIRLLGEQRDRQNEDIKRGTG